MLPHLTNHWWKMWSHQLSANMFSDTTQVLDTPEFFWSAPDSMQNLYKRVCEYMELDNRVEVLNNRLMVSSVHFCCLFHSMHSMLLPSELHLSSRACNARCTLKCEEIPCVPLCGYTACLLMAMSSRHVRSGTAASVLTLARRPAAGPAGDAGHAQGPPEQLARSAPRVDRHLVRTAE